MIFISSVLPAMMSGIDSARPTMSRIMDRFPLIITLGAALLGYLAGEMFVSDPATAAWFHTNMPGTDWLVAGGCAVLVVVVGLWLARRQHGDKHAASTG